MSGCSRAAAGPYTPRSAARPSARARTLQQPAIKTASGRAGAADARPEDPAPYDRGHIAGRCPPTVSDRRGAGPGPGWDWSLAAQPEASEPTAQRAPTAEALPSPGTRPHLCTPARGPSCAGAGTRSGPAAAHGAAFLFGEGETAYPHCRERHTEPPAGKEKGLQSRDRSSVLDSLLRQGTGRMAVLGVAPAQWAFHTGHTHASRSCWGVGASEWGRFRCHPAESARQKEGLGKPLLVPAHRQELLGTWVAGSSPFCGGWGYQSCLVPALDLPADSGSVSRGAPGLDDGKGGGRKVRLQNCGQELRAVHTALL